MEICAVPNLGQTFAVINNNNNNNNNNNLIFLL